MLKVAVISPFSPGPTCFCPCAVVVQPHEGRTDLIKTGASPLFSYLKTASTFEAPISGCRSSSLFSKTSAAGAEAATRKQSAVENKIRLPFMGQSKREKAAAVNVVGRRSRCHWTLGERSAYPRAKSIQL